MLSYQLFTLSRFWALKQNKSINLAQKFGTQYLIISFIGMNYNVINTMVNCNKFPLLVNSFIQITNNFAGKIRVSKTSNRKPKNKVSRMISICAVPGILLATANTLGALRRPEAPMLLTSLASEPRKLPALVRLAYCAFHGYLTCMQYTMPIFHLVTVICYVESLLPMIRALSLNQDSNGKINKRFPGKEDIYRSYHELTCVQRIFNSSYSHWALAAQTYFTIFSIANIFQAVSLSNRRGIIAGLVLITLACLIFRHLAHVYESSIQTLHSWKYTNEPLWFKKFVKACRPFRVAVGPFYYADYTLVLAMLSVIFVNSVNMIVTYEGT
ncbi:unnamed protein product [Allacma fusca]|uniref:Gustatory receptor n=1 Tax=Allacma fusca TaxID=39272 RepID=A0A8J2K2N0_9HEXA|nr:unnamed protein product [Allacma fusca]